jgi:hypothetical protein
VVSAVAISVFLLMSGQRGGDRVGQGGSRPADQAAQVTGVVEQLAAAQAKVGVGEDFRQPGGQSGPCQRPGELLRRQVGAGDLLPGGGRDRRGKLGQGERLVAGPRADRTVIWRRSARTQAT